jgi:lysophospholipase L1-like esterase
LTIVRRFVMTAAAAACLSFSACGGGSPMSPGRPPTLSVTCPANQLVQSTDGTPVSVSYSTPQAIGGSGTTTTTCTPQSGATFPVGNSTVTCEARDGGSQTASCSFTVAVQGPPRLVAAGKFLAFGDSLTAGVLSASPTLLITSSPSSYPTQLEQRLIARYRVQTPIVINEGNPGELASGTGVQRFRSVLLGYRPDVVLLMEGTNDLLFGETGAGNAINALRAMVREAKGQNVRIALATIPPQRLGTNRDAVARMIPGFNDRIRGLASAESIPLIDVFAGMDGDNSLIGVDNLHMTVRGYDVMTGIYFDAIGTHFEDRPAPSLLRR